MSCISSAAARGWGSCGFHGLDEFTEVRIYDELMGYVNSSMWTRPVVMRGTCCGGDTRSDDSEVEKK